jgi:hypothetical protein
MARRSRRGWPLLLVLILASSPAADAGPAAAGGSRALTFDDLVRGRVAVEQVHASWRDLQVGRNGPDRQSARDVKSVADDRGDPIWRLAERRVRESLALTALLRSRWGVEVTEADLAAELSRMASATRSPDRLRELYRALGEDPRLAAEILARDALVRRLARQRFDRDVKIHAAAYRAAERLRDGLASGRIDPWSTHTDRVVITRESFGQPPLIPEQIQDPDDVVSGSARRIGPRRRNDAAFERLLIRAHPQAGSPGEPGEEAGRLLIPVLLDDTPGEERLALYAIRKSRWNEWWSSHRQDDQVDTGPVLFGIESGLPADILSGPAPSTCPVDDRWTSLSTTAAPDGRMAHSAVWTGAEMIVWGGWSGTEALSTGGIYDPVLDTWTPTSTTGVPERRYWHTAVWTGTEMIVWGGSDQGLYLTTGGRYDPAGDAWSATSLTNAPAERASVASAWTGSSLVVWGGFQGTIFGLTFLDDGASYDPGTDSWSPISAIGAPSARRAPSVWIEGSLMVWGGYDGNGHLDDGALYDPNTDSWSAAGSGGSPPSGRESATLVWSGSEVLLWGGEDAGMLLGDGAAYDPSAGTWRPLPSSGGPGPRTLHAAVWAGDRMVVWGGWDGASLLDTGARYAPWSDAWTPATLSGAPGPRDQHTAVWAGDHLIAWGGWDGMSGAGDGGGYEVADLDMDGFGTCDGDCVDTDPATWPGAPQVCDGVNNDCLFPGWPVLAGTNEHDDDGDMLSECQGDCDDGDGSVWATPEEVPELEFLADTQTLEWTAPSEPGSLTVLYDTIRSDSPSDFTASATCTESGGTDLTSVDADLPDAGEVFYFLTLALNSCPAGSGSLGTTSDGTLRTAGSCP